MRRASQRLIASFATIAVVLASVNCWCGVALASARNCCAPRATRCCCDANPAGDRSDADHCRDHKGKIPDHGCQHCQGTLVSESAPVQHFSTPFDHSVLTAILDTSSLEYQTIPAFKSGRAFADFPPAISPPTLLGLHCAFTL
jgi:hypothetical protein